MSKVVEGLYYTQSHEWVRLEDDGSVTIGITDHAQDQLGDVVFFELPEVDTELGTGDAFGVVESVKTLSDLYAPIAGTVVAINEGLVDAPEVCNSDPYGEGWCVRLAPSAWDDEVDNLLDASAYQALVEAEDA